MLSHSLVTWTQKVLLASIPVVGPSQASAVSDCLQLAPQYGKGLMTNWGRSVGVYEWNVVTPNPWGFASPIHMKQGEFGHARGYVLLGKQSGGVNVIRQLLCENEQAKLE